MSSSIINNKVVIVVLDEDFLTTNEGNARELGEEDDENYYNEEIRVEDLAVELGYDADVAPYNDDTLGRLKVKMHGIISQVAKRDRERGVLFALRLTTS